MTETIKKSKRRFTKFIVTVNVLLIWGLMFYATSHNQLAEVVDACLALIGALIGIYTGVGHMDYRKALQMGLDSVRGGLK